MAIYVWGSTSHGELGLGGIADEQILTPRQMDWIGASDVHKIACGSMHTLLLTKNGRVYSCGNNDHGQLGHNASRKRPQLITTLEDNLITQISCGANHSLAINEWGQLYSWGSNSNGQLGLETDESMNGLPKLIKSLATKQAVQIACGAYHCLVLLNNGDLYGWGCNSYGQLGLGEICLRIINPTLIASLSGIPISSIQCGANHSFAVSKSGAVFGWGKNAHGQLGLNDVMSRKYPTQLKTLRTLGVRHIACGDEFSVFLTKDGGVFTCGSGTYGQLGHGGNSNEIVPRMIMELMGTTCTQITCGRRHTLTFVPSRGRVYGFGLGGSGQLGSRTTTNSTIPQVVLGPWVSPSGISLLNDNSDTENIVENLVVKRIFSGGDHSLVCTSKKTIEDDADETPPYDSRFYESNTQIVSLTLEMMMECLKYNNNESDKINVDTISTIEIGFKNLACLNGSFLLESVEPISCSSRQSCVDLDLTEKIFDTIRKFENDSLKSLIWDSITIDLIKSLKPSPPDIETLRVYMVLPLYHEFLNSKNYEKLHSPFCRVLLSLREIPCKIISIWWAEATVEYYEKLVEIFKGVVEHIIFFKFRTDPHSDKKLIRFEENMVLALRFLRILYVINRIERKTKISSTTFSIPEISDAVDIQEDYLNWVKATKSHGGAFSLCDFPFIYDTKAKTSLLEIDQAVQMHCAIRSPATILGVLRGSDVPEFLILNITRENIVADTLREIGSHVDIEFKKPLKIKFSGEEANDAGGVRKEFFLLLVKDLLDPQYGMFQQYEATNYMWFYPHSFETLEMYTLIGILCGLAIYNCTIINLPFPLALYKKLLKETPDLTDLEDLSPVEASSLQALLDYNESDFKETFEIRFEISREVFGERKNVNLKENGDTISVTQENKEEFVRLYVDYIFNKSIENEYNAFSSGFMKVCGGGVIELFQPQELMALVIGNTDYDWHALESVADYKNGYTSGDQTIRWFWEIFHELPLNEKKNFLLFLTGSDRIPFEGMKAIKIIFQPTNDERCLPVAHTCFNLLDLPRYQTKERLKFKLSQAIQQTQGFSIV